MSQGGKKQPNRLIHEKSPYLLQHAYNPVDWFPWGSEAFKKSKAEDKPIFLSIGYSTCHWCHVMEKESFEDPEVAELLNTVFVAIKVDREERPDIDSIYMTVCQMLTQRGGWPLTIIMTPDKRPFFAGTYLPKTNRFGQVGMLELLPRIAHLWKNSRNDLLDSADKIIAALQETGSALPSTELNKDTHHRAFTLLSQDFDERQGGFGKAPKFPIPHHLNFLLRYWKRTEEARALSMVEKTLTEMRRGGIFDHIGYGFHRYSTDSHWLLPHFEKMLYDQALIAWAYLETFLATKRGFYRDTAEEIFTYVLRDMTSPQGAFFSAEDADSEGIEGKFYTFTSDEIKRILSPNDVELALRVFSINAEGNFQDESETGPADQNILHLKSSWEDLAQEFKLSDTELKTRIESIRTKIFAYRNKRERPLRDEKILADWNGLMIAALAKGAQVCGRREYSQAAKRAADFIWKHMYDAKAGLLHRHKSGDSGIPAFADDYAFLVWGFIELYHATFEEEYLQKALELNRLFLSRFWDNEEHGFFFTSDRAESLFLREKEIYDGAVPSSNSVAMLNLLRLGRLSGDPELENSAAQLAHRFSGDVGRYPPGHTFLLNALDFSFGPSQEIVIVGDPKALDTKMMTDSLRSEFIPNSVWILVSTAETKPQISHIAPFTADLKSLDGKATAYVCTNFACNNPTTDPEKMLALLK